MLVIHGVWARGALCLWAEDARLPARTPESLDGVPGGRRSRAPRPHPFAADPETIAGALASLGDAAGEAARQAPADELPCWLPSAPDGPQPAPELIRPAAEADGTSRARWPALGCWRVPALAIEPPAALGVLAALDRLAAAGELGGAGELAAGGSVAYWAAVAWFADDLAARGRVLPALVPPADDTARSAAAWAARWYPVLTGHDARRAAEFADAMPPLCRAAEPGGEPPAPILAAALAALADAAARARLAAGPPGWTLLPARRGRRPAHVPVAERWAAALASPDPHVLVDAAEDETAAALAAALDDWRAAAQAPAGPVRTCFRLVEPSAEPAVAADPADAQDPAGLAVAG